MRRTKRYMATCYAEKHIIHCSIATEKKGGFQYFDFMEGSKQDILSYTFVPSIRCAKQDVLTK